MISVTLDGVAPDIWYEDNAILLDYGIRRRADARMAQESNSPTIASAIRIPMPPRFWLRAAGGSLDRRCRRDRRHPVRRLTPHQRLSLEHRTVEATSGGSSDRQEQSVQLDRDRGRRLPPGSRRILRLDGAPGSPTVAKPPCLCHRTRHCRDVLPVDNSRICSVCSPAIEYAATLIRTSTGHRSPERASVMLKSGTCHRITRKPTGSAQERLASLAAVERVRQGF